MLGRRERCLADVEGGRKKSKIDPTVTMEKDSPDEKECSTLMSLPEEMLCAILQSAYAGANKPADVVNLSLTCRHFNQVGAQACVRKFASLGALTLRASMWSEEASKFLMTCALAGNKEAMFFLGMILFYCIRSFRLGAGLLSRAAALGHANSLHALGVILFNGSGGTKEDRLPRVAASLCLKASKFGHIQALRELGHCHQDGHGVQRNVKEGLRMLLQANLRCQSAVPCTRLPPARSPPLQSLLLPAAHASGSSSSYAISLSGFTSEGREEPTALNYHRLPSAASLSLKNDDGGLRPEIAAAPAPGPADQPHPPSTGFSFENLEIGTAMQASCQHGYAHSHSFCPGPLRQICLVLRSEPRTPPTPMSPQPPINSPASHPVHSFLAEWVESQPLPPGMGSCLNPNCNRPETRMHEFRCCMLCNSARYCTRNCQVEDWRFRHRKVCGERYILRVRNAQAIV